MTQLKPKRIIQHFGLHKTVRTDQQRNFNSKHNNLLNQSILYLGPRAFKKQCRDLLRYPQWNKAKKQPTQKLVEQTLNILKQRAGESTEQIHTILISFEAIFGTLRADLAQKSKKTSSNGENKLELYRYSKRRTQCLMQGIESTIRTKNIEWTICFASRQQNDFIRSCHIQMIKGSHEITDMRLEEFIVRSDFSYAKPSQLLDELKALTTTNKPDILYHSSEYHIDRSDPSVYHNNFIELVLPERAKQAQSILINQTDSKNLHKNVNPVISKRGLNIAREARPIFTKQKWKLFRKLLAKNFVKSI